MAALAESVAFAKLAAFAGFVFAESAADEPAAAEPAEAEPAFADSVEAGSVEAGSVEAELTGADPAVAAEEDEDAAGAVIPVISAPAAANASLRAPSIVLIKSALRRTDTFLSPIFFAVSRSSVSFIVERSWLCATGLTLS
ncbi:hypothetical protein HMPREF0620_1453 [Parascardovia denticolens DSM 10105 = JCM 12538]|uniref:Secreted protein n=1 Tax=Parascardovia denticolens DSM 10105 = JCM 12538 TaxID=864564 RepID=E6K1Y0_PARDN|nr:hypothetical protein HMPREF0620_1453 [Parascardovia denticolens DSM 10105 = JCM 12538]